jgi:putative PIN family toxin of toxin-antitoxin system
VRVVLDSSVLVSAMLSPGGPSGAVLRASHGPYELFLSSGILDELVDVLLRPRVAARHPFTGPQIAQIRQALEEHAQIVRGEYVDLDIVPTDVKDNHVAGAALEARAHYLVTLDGADLLSRKVFLVAGHAPVQVVSPEDFLRLLG